MMANQSDKAQNLPLTGSAADDLASIRRHVVIARKQLADGEGIDGETVFACLQEAYVLRPSNGG